MMRSSFDEEESDANEIESDFEKTNRKVFDINLEYAQWEELYIEKFYPRGDREGHFEGVIDGEATPCDQAKDYLKKNIALPQHERYFRELCNIPDIDIDDELTSAEHEIDNFGYFDEIKTIYNICEKSGKTQTGDRDNIYHCPSLAKKVLKFCQMNPTCTAVMNTHFRYNECTVSSAPSESMFNDV
ncbi:hypothetical protein U1Q18_050332 [Sarracenia purpurea var. burkii]